MWHNQDSIKEANGSYWVTLTTGTVETVQKGRKSGSLAAVNLREENDLIHRVERTISNIESHLEI